MSHRDSPTAADHADQSSDLPLHAVPSADPAQSIADSSPTHSASPEMSITNSSPASQPQADAAQSKDAAEALTKTHFPGSLAVLAEEDPSTHQLRKSDAHRHLPGWDSRPGNGACSFPPKIGRYKILGRLGQGGMGVVYRAFDPQLNRTVALKMLSATHATDAALLERFRIEAEATAQLQHPNIVQIYEVGTYSDLTGFPQPYLALEFVAGPNLAAWLRGRPCSARESAQLVRKLALAIDAAHRKGILHRDLKPSNILLVAPTASATASQGPALPNDAVDAAAFSLADCEPKITDFGLAKRLDASQGLTATGEVVGTPAYMAPEQIRPRSQQHGPWVDIYALGGILYELLTGRPPFMGALSMEVLLRVIQEDPIAPQRLEPSIPRDLETICLKCLEKLPRHRYPSALALAEDLERFLRRQPIQARPVGRVERLLKLASRHPLEMGLILTICATISLGVAGIAWKWREAEQQRERAVSSSIEANEQSRIAEERRQSAELAGQQAYEKALAEQKARQEVEAQKRQVEMLRDQTERLLYCSQMMLAAREWADGGVSRARELLTKSPSAWRGWESGYLNRILGRGYRPIGQLEPATSHLRKSPDGRWYAYSNGAGRLLLGELATGKPVRMGRFRAGVLTHLDFSPDGSQLAMSMADAILTFRVPELTLLQEIRPPRANSIYVGGVRYHPSAKVLIAHARQRGLVLISLETGKEVGGLALPPHAFADTIEISRDGKTIFAGGSNFGLMAWDYETRTPLGPLEFPETASVRSLQLSPDGKMLLAGCSDQFVRVYDAMTRRLLRIDGGFAGEVKSLSISVDGQAYLTASDRLLRLKHLKTGQPLRVLRGADNEITNVVLSHDASHAVSVSIDGRLMHWDCQVEQEFIDLSSNRLDGYVVAPKTGELALAELGRLRLVDPRSAKVLWSIVLPDQDPRNGSLVAFSSKAEKLYCGSFSNGTFVLDGKTGEKLYRLATNNYLERLRLSADDRLLLALYHDALEVWDTSTHQKRYRFQPPGHELNDAVFSADGRWVIVVSRQGRIACLDSKTGQLVLEQFSPHRESLEAVAVSADGRWLAVRVSNHRIDVWKIDSDSLRKHVSFAHHGESLVFSPDSTRLVSSSKVGPVQMWMVETGQDVFVLGESSHSVANLRFSPEGDRLYGLSRERRLRCWESEKPPRK